MEALLATTTAPNPRRAVVGWDANRLAMILAVLEARCGLSLGNRDVYLNVVGGFKLADPAADFAVAMALASCAYGQPLPIEAVFLGEIGLSGELRGVRHADLRCSEAARLGFPQAKGYFQGVKKPAQAKVTWRSYRHVKEALVDLFGQEV